MQQPLMQQMAAYCSSNVTTDHIQQYLDENKSLILKIVESQSAGKLSECAENQARLQRNLMYLAAIADSQPQTNAVRSQFFFFFLFSYCFSLTRSSYQNPTTGMYAQQQQAAQSHALMAAGRTSMLYSQQPYYQALQQHSMHSSFGTSSSAGSSGLSFLQGEPNGTAGGSGVGFSDLGRSLGQGGLSSGVKQDMRGADGSSGGGRQSLFLKTEGGN
uniref:GRF1-interacting factor n=1 Tax=Tamarix hispida TaxID=189793 RepID=A0A4P8FA86_9CARY|nr:GRF1-interacting factor [Tamarix hispida]